MGSKRRSEERRLRREAIKQVMKSPSNRQEHDRAIYEAPGEKMMDFMVECEESSIQNEGTIPDQKVHCKDLVMQLIEKIKDDNPRIGYIYHSTCRGCTSTPANHVIKHGDMLVIAGETQYSSSSDDGPEFLLMKQVAYRVEYFKPEGLET